MQEYGDETNLYLTSVDGVSVSDTRADVTVDNIEPSTITDWEVWEGTLVQLDDVTVLGEAGFGHFTLDVDIGGSSLIVDQHFMRGYLSEYICGGLTLESLIGIVSYEYGIWRILPRTPADIVLGPATSC